jgi:hypothetical protein
MTPDDNDILYSTYGLDIGGLLRFLYEKIFGGDGGSLISTLELWWNIYSVIAILLSLLFFIGYIYAKIRYGQLHEIEHNEMHAEEHAWAVRHGDDHSENSRWKNIQQRIAENNPESWRVAIIEADIFLDETLNEAGYVGVSLGEKLKSANPQSFTTIQDAWEAHKVRNEIAHVGSDFILTRKIAQDTLLRFERVFREFGVI